MPALLLVGDDKLSRTLAHRVEKAGINLPIYVDRSWGCSRVWAMVRRGVLSPLVVARMAWAELCRPAPPTGAWPAIRSNRELVAACRREEADRVYLFRVGLIIGPPVLEAGLEVFNLHCASPPRFGGLEALSRALGRGGLGATGHPAPGDTGDRPGRDRGHPVLSPGPAALLSPQRGPRLRGGDGVVTGGIGPL